MLQPVIELKKILQEELETYRRIFFLEENKSQAILDRDGKIIEELSVEQEKLLEKVSGLEKRREGEIQRYRDIYRLDDLKEDITLKDIVNSMDEDSSHQLLMLGMDLKKLLLKLGSLQKSNEKLIRDNLEFYDILLSGLRDGSKIDAGYSNDGKEDGKIGGSILIDHTA